MTDLDTSISTRRLLTDYGHTVEVAHLRIGVAVIIGPGRLGTGFCPRMSSAQAMELAEMLRPPVLSGAVAQVPEQLPPRLPSPITTLGGFRFRVEPSTSPRPAVWIFQEGKQSPVLRLNSPSALRLRAELVHCAHTAEAERAW